MRAEAEAESIKIRGLAEAEALQAKGMAEAEALQRKVTVLNQQNQAAILDTALSGLPIIAGKLAEAYGKIGSVTYVASGDGEGVTSRIARDVVGMIPMMSAMFESTTGMKLRDLIEGMKNGKEGSVVEGASQPAPAMVESSEPGPAAASETESGNGAAAPTAKAVQATEAKS